MGFKVKTHSGAKKRFKKVASGTKIKFSKSYRRKFLTKKTSKNKRRLRAGGYFGTSDIRHIRPLLPY
jgi:large subunit ribosomal protein L35